MSIVVLKVGYKLIKIMFTMKMISYCLFIVKIVICHTKHPKLWLDLEMGQLQHLVWDAIRHWKNAPMDANMRLIIYIYSVMMFVYQMDFILIRVKSLFIFNYFISYILRYYFYFLFFYCFYLHHYNIFRIDL